MNKTSDEKPFLPADSEAPEAPDYSWFVGWRMSKLSLRDVIQALVSFYPLN